jgi:hypothetical protein
MPEGRPPSFESFTCPHCQALYHLVKAEASPETNVQVVACLVCFGALTAREGTLVLNYFLLRKAGRGRRRAVSPATAPS